MSIQENINKALEYAINEKLTRDYINDLKFLKSELQRGKTKESSDHDTINILITLIKKQNEMSLLFEVGSSDYMDIKSFISRVEHFLDQDILDQVYAYDSQIISWIDNNVDKTNIKNNNQIIGIVKKAFPYIDGNVIKDSIKIMEAR
jgi:hypothetical protein